MRVVQLGRDEIDRVEALWKQMVEHHRRVAARRWPVRLAQDAWELRRRDYANWLAAGQGRMFAAVEEGDEDGAPLGYAVLRTTAPGATWEMGELVGELESLVVEESARGRGIGTLLIDHCREVLRAEGIGYWDVAVVEGNEEATRLYERAGFRPYFRYLHERID